MIIKLMIKITCLILVLLILPTRLTYAGGKGNEYTSFFGFALNKGTLSDIQKKLGNAPLIEKGDAGDYEASICYLLPSGYTVAFLSGELGGSNHDFLGYSVHKTIEPEENCLRLESSEIRSFKLHAGKLRIGMTKKEFIQAFGKNINWLQEDRAMVFFESKRKMTKRELQEFKKTSPAVSEYPYFDVIISLSGKFKEGVLNEFIVWKTETN